MIINVRTYADFKLVANTLRHLDAVFYKNSTTIVGATFGVAYAFDYQSGTVVAATISGGITFSTADFPSAIAIGDHFLISQQTVNSDTF